MSCCKSCEQSGGNCNQGLGMLGATLVAGSQIRAGFWLSSNTPNYSIDEIINTVEGCLYQSGSFNFVQVFFQPEGVFSDAYMTVAAETYHDFAQAEDAGGYIQQALQNCFPELIIQKRDRVAVDYVPGGSISNPGIQQPTNPSSNSAQKCPSGFYDNGWFSVNCVPLPANTPINPSQCDWDKLSLADYAACQLGIKPSQAVIAGVVVALVGVIAISKIAK